MNVLVVTGLTLPEVTDADREMILAAGGPGTTVTVVSRLRDALVHAPRTDITRMCESRIVVNAPSTSIACERGRR